VKNKVLDAKDEQILELLSKDARLSYSTLANHVGLSSPAVKERILKMEDAGVITGYEVKINKQALGKHISAYILVDVPYNLEKSFIQFANEELSFDSCHHLLGRSAFIAEARLESMEALEQLIKRCMKFGQTTTHMLLSQVKP
jgi:Lrp/AsnC family leucine-responsive transcriptional regulator